ncbi:hypothetical protein [Streptomyces shenzhenensis]|uniref:hypothetical protein n=1 Tax=Streptomyces shenzhenensis TaxID=943815 RepID=UPI001F15E093|nr:hypothetical protein [Streptomyces shenzhenensis]
MCLIKKVLNRKILVPLAIAVVGTLALPASWDLVAFPLLVLLVCPLTVLVMMRDRRTDVDVSVTDAEGPESDPTTLTDEAIEGRIRALQAELRHLKATQARRAEEAATVHSSRNPGGPDEPGPATRSS